MLQCSPFDYFKRCKDQQDGSAGKGSCHQAWWPEFYAWKPHDQRQNQKLSFDLHMNQSRPPNQLINVILKVKRKRKILNIKKHLIMFLETPFSVFVMLTVSTIYSVHTSCQMSVLSINPHNNFIRWVAFSVFYRWENTDLKRVINMPETLPICDAFGISEMKLYP